MTKLPVIRDHVIKEVLRSGDIQRMRALLTSAPPDLKLRSCGILFQSLLKYQAVRREKVEVQG